jgi:hypothetical protein
MTSVNNNVDTRYHFMQSSTMAKSDTIGIRLDPQELKALRLAAASDDRSISALGRKIIVEWLIRREEGKTQ